MVPWAHMSQLPKWHIDRFSRFCRAHPSDQHTDRQTTLRVTSIIIGQKWPVCDFVGGDDRWCVSCGQWSAYEKWGQTRSGNRTLLTGDTRVCGTLRNSWISGHTAENTCRHTHGSVCLLNPRLDKCRHRLMRRLHAKLCGCIVLNERSIRLWSVRYMQQVFPWAHRCPRRKRHLDRFSRFPGPIGDRPTDRPTDHAIRSVTIGWTHSGEAKFCYYLRLQQVFIGAVYLWAGLRPPSFDASPSPRTAHSFGELRQRRGLAALSSLNELYSTTLSTRPLTYHLSITYWPPTVLHLIQLDHSTTLQHSPLFRKQH